MCNRLSKTFQNFLKHGWFVPLAINLVMCFFYGIYKIIVNIIKLIPHQVWKELFPYLKLKDKNLTLSKKVYVYINIILQVWVFFIIGLYILLPHISNGKYVYSNTTFYTVDLKSNEQTREYLKSIQSNIRNNLLYSPKLNIDIYLLDHTFMYILLNPVELLPHRQTFAITHYKSIFVNHADLEKNIVYASNGASENLDAILVHESVHVMQNSRYGWLYSSFKMPYWVKEGYAVYSAWALSRYKKQELVSYLLKVKNIQFEHWDAFTKDQFYALMVEHAIEKMHKSVDDLHLGKVDYQEVLSSLLQEYNITK